MPCHIPETASRTRHHIYRERERERERERVREREREICQLADPNDV